MPFFCFLSPFLRIFFPPLYQLRFQICRRHSARTKQRVFTKRTQGRFRLHLIPARCSLISAWCEDNADARTFNGTDHNRTKRLNSAPWLTHSRYRSGTLIPHRALLSLLSCLFCHIGVRSAKHGNEFEKPLSRNKVCKSQKNLPIAFLFVALRQRTKRHG